MRKVTILVAVFLIGITAQAFNNNQKNVVINTGTTHFNPATNVSFEEGGIIYTVNTRGAFDFETYKSRPHYKYKRGKRKGNTHHVNYSNKRPRGHVRYKKVKPKQIFHDSNGAIIQIGRTLVTYKKNGKVKTIGDIALHYHKGRLIQVGGMEIEYNRFGKIRNTYGSIHNYNNHVWHDDCNLIDNDANHHRPRRGRRV